MSIYSSRTLHRTLGAFSAFAGGGRNIFGDFGFAESWSSDDFESNTQFNSWVKPYLDQVGRTGMTWSPPSTSLRTRASTVWGTWKSAADAGSQAASGYIDKITSQMNTLIARADQLSLSGSLGHRTEAIEVQRYDTFNEIKQVINKVASSGTQANDALTAANAIPDSSVPSAAPVTGDTTSGGVSASAIVSKSAAAATGTGAGGATGDGSDNTLLYVGLAAGALLLIGGGYMLMKKKSTATAGYRRRKRRRR